MREQPRIAHANAYAARNPPEKYRDEERFPGEEKKRRNCSHMECDEDQQRRPRDRPFKCFIVPKSA